MKTLLEGENSRRRLQTKSHPSDFPTELLHAGLKEEYFMIIFYSITMSDDKTMGDQWHDDRMMNRVVARWSRRRLFYDYLLVDDDE